MKKIKVMTVVGTRPEIIRLSRVMPLLDKYLKQIVVHTGQNYDYELNEIFFKDLKIRKPDYFLSAAGKTASETIGKILIKIDPLIEKEDPDLLLVLGDTNSCLAAIAAKKRKIPVFHLEAGNRCFDQRVPEEVNRKILDHLSDINLPYSSIARGYLLDEGLPSDQIIKTGSPMQEVLEFYEPAIESSKIMKILNLNPFEYFLVSLHREENIDSAANFNKLVGLLKYLSQNFRKKIIISTHPRTRKMFTQKKIKLNKNVKFLKPFAFTDYIKLQKNAYVVLSDSGTITEESSILNFPALNIREAHERPEGMEESSVMMVGLDKDVLLHALKILESQPRGRNRVLKIVKDYNTSNFSEKVLRIILSHLNYVNRKVWHEKI